MQVKLAEGWLQAGNQAEFDTCIQNLLESNVRMDEENKGAGVRHCHCPREVLLVASRCITSLLPVMSKYSLSDTQKIVLNNRSVSICTRTTDHHPCVAL